MDPTEPPPEATARKRGRPTKCTPEMADRIAAHVKKGHFLHVAAQLCGINSRTYFAWMARGEKERGTPFRRFYLRMQQANADAQEYLLRLVRRGAIKDGRLALEILGRRWPNEWAPPKDRVELDANLNHSGGVRVWLPPEET